MQFLNVIMYHFVTAGEGPKIDLPLYQRSAPVELPQPEWMTFMRYGSKTLTLTLVFLSYFWVVSWLSSLV